MGISRGKEVEKRRAIRWIMGMTGINGRVELWTAWIMGIGGGWREFGGYAQGAAGEIR